jgi:putative Mn2+ efflux pump MntP
MINQSPSSIRLLLCSALCFSDVVVHYDFLVMGKVFGVAFAVGLDVLPISLGAGVARLAFDASLRVGIAFASSEIAMQIIGYGLGVGASHMLGEIAAYVGSHC